MIPRADVSVLVIAAGLVACWAAVVAWQHRDQRGARSLAVLMVAAAWTAFTTVGGFTADTYSELLLWRQVRQLGFATFAPALLMFTAGYAEIEWLTTRRVVVVLSAATAAISAGILTTHVHWLFYVGGEYMLVEGIPRGGFGRGPLYWVYIAYAYLLVGTGTVLVVRRAVRTRHLFRRQAVVVVVFALVPWVSNMIAVAAPMRILFDPTVVMVPAAGALVAVGVYRYRVLDAAPVARGIVLDHIDDGVLVVDRDGTLVDYNRTMWRYLGANPVGKDVGDLGSEALAAFLTEQAGGDDSTATADGGTDDLTGQADDGGDVGSVDLLDATGETRTFDVRRSSMADTRGEELAAVYLFRDVTERREREAELRRRNEELDRFAGVVSHDLRNPLAVAEGYLELAEETGEEEHFERVSSAHDRLGAIIRDLLALARTDEADVEPMHLGETVRRAWRHVDTKDASLVVDVSDDVSVLADPARLDRLFENIIRNAIEHGGVDVTITVTAGDDWFSIGDDGPGLPPDIRDAAFEHGASGGDGTGMGLAIVRSVAEAHGWTVTIDDDADGARFVVSGVTRASQTEE